MARRLRNLTTLFVALFLAQALLTGYWQIWRRTALALDPRNTRVLIAEEGIHRGAILDRRWRVLAHTSEVDGRFVRRYPRGPLFAHVIGYRSTTLGKVGLERALDLELLGFGQRDRWQDLRAGLAGQTRRRGADAFLTIDAAVQQAAWEALSGRRGAVVVLDPRDGAVLAMVTSPSFDPNSVEEEWEALRQAEGAPLLNRAAQGQYTPGSAFKVITMAAALSQGIATPETRYRDPGSVIVKGTRVTNFEGRACGTVTLFDALVRSCNVVFIKVGLALGGPPLREFARRFGIGRAPAFDLPASAGRLPSAEEVRGEGVGQMAFGQGSLAVSPLQIALVAATIAQGGAAPRPYLVKALRTRGGNIAEVRRPDPPEQMLDATVARVIAEAMVEVVRRGTGRAAAIEGVTVAGKTGTATVPGGRSHAWFIGFAPAEAPQVAIAIVLEHGGVGGRDAAPLARRILQAALMME